MAMYMVPPKSTVDMNDVFGYEMCTLILLVPHGIRAGLETS